MSATLDGARVAALLGNAPVIESEGRAFPVETALSRPRCPRADRAAGGGCRLNARCVRRPARCWYFCRARGKFAAPRCFLKERVTRPRMSISSRFTARSTCASRIAPFRRRRPGRRKVVLATSIAETSLTIEGVRVVIDSGLSRLPRYEPEVGLTRLETMRVSRAAADQRRGRAAAAPNPVFAIGCGTSPKPVRWSPIRGPKCYPRTCHPSSSTWRSGARRSDETCVSRCAATGGARAKRGCC